MPTQGDEAHVLPLNSGIHFPSKYDSMVLASGCKSWLKAFFHNCLWCVFVLSPPQENDPNTPTLKLIFKIELYGLGINIVQ